MAVIVLLVSPLLSVCVVVSNSFPCPPHHGVIPWGGEWKEEEEEEEEEKEEEEVFMIVEYYGNLA